MPDKPRPPRAGWRRVLPTRRQALWGLLGLFALLVAGCVAGYALTDIPAANAIVRQQATHVYYSDGHTLLGRIGSVNRTNVPLSKVPKPVREAVLAAEDRNFYSEPGISPTGILRALWVDVRGGDIQQGGSTITQQYAKNAYLTQERSFTRKIKEIFIAVKLSRQRSKDEVLQDYLNTIYFGRGAYGIQAAAHAYFRKDVSALTPAEGAVLAAVIRAPTALDPARNQAANERRWHYVVDGMVAEHWLPRADADALRYPTVQPPPSGQQVSGPNGFVMEAVKAELARRGFDENRLNLGGYTVVTTIDKQAQDAAVKAVDDVTAKLKVTSKDPQLNGRRPLTALVSVQPGDGAVRAMYGGRDFAAKDVPKSFVNLVYDRRQPGSSFKAYTLVTALKQGISLRSVYDGSSPKYVKGYPPNNQVRNDSNEQCPYPCSLVRATAESINTVYVPLAITVGPDKVRDTAYAMGVSRENPLSGDSGHAAAGITLGIYPVRPIDQAVGYATLAAGGVRNDPYLIGKVLDGSGQVVYRSHPHGERVMDTSVAADATYALEQVLQPGGTAHGKAPAGRPAAGKTGTTTKHADAWFVGYTPQLSTAVWMGNPTAAEPLVVNGSGVYGGAYPASVWQEYMTEALQGKPVAELPQPTFSGEVQGQPATPSPSPSASVSATASPSPSGSPSPTGTVLPLPTGSGSPGVPSDSPPPSGSPSPSPAPAPTSTTQSAAPKPGHRAGTGTSVSPSP